jgi:hypothetical protein
MARTARKLAAHMACSKECSTAIHSDGIRTAASTAGSNNDRSNNPMKTAGRSRQPQQQDGAA